MKQRQPTKQPDLRPPRDTQAKGLVATTPKVNKDRTAMVPNFDPGIKGKQQKRRKSWPY